MSHFEKGCPIKCTRQPQKCIVRGLEFTVFQRNLKQWQERPWTYMSASAIKESNKSRFDSYSVRNSVLIITRITLRDCRVHIFPDNLSRNSCIKKGSDFTSWSILKGGKICHLGLLNGPIGLIDEWYDFEKSRERSVFEIACSQTLYFLCKVRREWVIKYKTQGIYWPPVQGGRNEKKNKTTSMYRLFLRLISI